LDSEVSPDSKTTYYIYPAPDDTKLSFKDLDKAIPFDANHALDPKITEACDEIGSLFVGLKKRERTTLLNIMYNLYFAREVSIIRGEPVYVRVSLNANDYTGLMKWYKKHISYIFIRRSISSLEAGGWITIHPGFINREKKRSRTTRLAPTRKLEGIFKEYKNEITPIKLPSVSPVLFKDEKKRFCEPPDERAHKEFSRNVEKINANNREHRTQIPYETVYNELPFLLRSKFPTPLLTNTDSDSIPTRDYTLYPGYPLSPLTNRFWKDLACRYSVLIRLCHLKRVSNGMVDLTSDIEYTRVFNNGVLTEGGRFYCPFQSLPGVIRRRVLIDGESVVELDFSAMHMRMLYAKKSYPLTDDPYTIPGYEYRRPDIKKANLTAINASNRHKAGGALRNDGITDADEILDAFEKNHSRISDYFFSGEGIRLQYIDSRIAEQVMLSFYEMGEACLCVHDSFIVKASLEKVLRLIMEDEYVNEVGFKPVIDKKE
jgi:hypothetical protein